MVITPIGRKVGCLPLPQTVFQLAVLTFARDVSRATELNIPHVTAPVKHRAL